MGTDDLTINRQRLRGSDSNTLLRLYDQANERLGACTTQVQRAQADRAIRLVGDELRRRQVSYRTGQPAVGPTGGGGD
jgi:hypothetical protein